MANSETVAFNFDPLRGAGGAVRETVASNFHPLLGGSGGGGVAVANPVGINFAAGGGGALSYEAFPIFKNRVREARGFTDVATISNQVPLSAAGWPAADFSCLLVEGMDLTPSWLSLGQFACGFLTTTGTETISAVFSATISNIVRGAIGTYTTFDCAINGANAGFSISGTAGQSANVFAFLPAYRSSAPAAGTSGPIDDPTTAAAFTQESILHYSQYAHLRLMKYSFAEANTQLSTSATRRTAANTQTAQFGFPLSYSFTAMPGNGATSLTLTAPWPRPTGSYGFTFWSPSDNQARLCTCTNGSTAVTWTAPLTEATVFAGTKTKISAEPYPIEWMVAFCNACNIGIWINTPTIEDGTQSSAGSWSSAVMDYLIAHWTSSGKIYFEMGNENWNSSSSPSLLLAGLAAVYGFTDIYHYIAYRLHTFANLCRTKFPTTFGSKVNQVFGGRITGDAGGNDWTSGILTALAVLAAPSADVQFMAFAGYVTPTVGDSDSVATILNTTLNAAATVTLMFRAENALLMALQYGIPTCTYEGGGQWDAVNGNNPNVGLAIMNAGMTAAITTLCQGLFNSGCAFITHFGSGVTAISGNKSPINDLSNIYASPLTSSTLSALQSFMAGATRTRNMVSGSGSVISGINYADNSADLVNSPGHFNFDGSLYGPHYFVSGYCPYLINCTAPGTYALTVNFTVSSGSPTTDLEVNGTVLSSAIPVTTGNVAMGNVALKAGVNYVLLGKSGSQAGVAVNSLTFN